MIPFPEGVAFLNHQHALGITLEGARPIPNVPILLAGTSTIRSDLGKGGLCPKFAVYFREPGLAWIWEQTKKKKKSHVFIFTNSNCVFHLILGTKLFASLTVSVIVQKSISSVIQPGIKHRKMISLNGRIYRTSITPNALHVYTFVENPDLKGEEEKSYWSIWVAAEVRLEGFGWLVC